LSYRRRHLKKQAGERDNVEKKKREAAAVDLTTGQPLAFYCGADGLTEHRTISPKDRVGTKGSNLDVGSLTNRCMGVEVICGPINAIFLYYTDDFTSKGSNLMVEVIRQAMADLGEQLAIRGLELPKVGFFSFDNSGENKNRSVFAYFSLLVEMKILQRIELYFLIVGHTHTPLDQYFSVLSRRIKSVRFVGSPASMRDLLKHAHSDLTKQPVVSKLLPVLYNVKEAWAPYIAPIKYYQTPHCFLFEFNPVLQKGTMPYKLFSDFVWQPSPPPSTEQNRVEEMNVPVCPLVGGWVDFLASSVHGSALNVCPHLMTRFNEVESDAQQNFMSDNLDEYDPIDTSSSLPSLSTHTQVQYGYITLLNASPDLFCSLPKVIDPRIEKKDVVATVSKVAGQVVGAIKTKTWGIQPGDQYVHTGKRLTSDEIAFWTSLSTAPLVNSYLDRYLQTAAPWSPSIPLSIDGITSMNDPEVRERMDRAAEEYRENLLAIQEHCDRVLVREVDRLNPHENIIGAPGLPFPTWRGVGARAAATSMNPVDLQSVENSGLLTCSKAQLVAFCRLNNLAVGGVKPVLSLRILRAGYTNQQVVDSVPGAEVAPHIDPAGADGAEVAPHIDPAGADGGGVSALEVIIAEVASEDMSDAEESDRSMSPGLNHRSKRVRVSSVQDGIMLECACGCRGEELSNTMVRCRNCKLLVMPGCRNYMSWFCGRCEEDMLDSSSSSSSYV
jgi:hypothetical protein